MSIVNIGLSQLALAIYSCTKRWFEDEVLNESKSMKSVRDEIRKYNKAYHVAIDILRRRSDNIHDKQVLENNKLV